MKVYNKLIRDNIDDIIINNGKNEVPHVRILSSSEYKIELLKKLDEELMELTEAILSGSIDDITEESADVIEVIRAINGDDLDLVINKLEDKRKKRGGFSKRKYLEYVK